VTLFFVITKNKVIPAAAGIQNGKTWIPAGVYPACPTVASAEAGVFRRTGTTED